MGFNQGWDINKGGYKRGMTVLIKIPVNKMVESNTKTQQETILHWNPYCKRDLLGYNKKLPQATPMLTEAHE